MDGPFRSFGRDEFISAGEKSGSNMERVHRAQPRAQSFRSGDSFDVFDTRERFSGLEESLIEGNIEKPFEVCCLWYYFQIDKGTG